MGFFTWFTGALFYAFSHALGKCASEDVYWVLSLDIIMFVIFCYSLKMLIEVMDVFKKYKDIFMNFTDIQKVNLYFGYIVKGDCETINRIYYGEKK